MREKEEERGEREEKGFLRTSPTTTMLSEIFEFLPFSYSSNQKAMRSPKEPFFPRGAPELEEDEEEEHASIDARVTRARSSSGAGRPRDPSLSSSANATTTVLMPRLLSPRSLALGAVAASLLVYVCATALVPSPVRWFFLKIVRCIGGREREKQLLSPSPIFNFP